MRRYNYNPEHGRERCAATVRLRRTTETAQCGRRAVVGKHCRQHAAVEQRKKASN